jgi:hypothetical protein
MAIRLQSFMNEPRNRKFYANWWKKYSPDLSNLIQPKQK